MIIPGSVIPKWFIHQSIGAEVNMEKPSSHLCDSFMGIAVCVVFSSFLRFSLVCQFIANGKLILSIKGVLGVHDALLSDHIWLFFVLPQYFMEEDIKLLNECEANELSQIGIKIETHDSRSEVKKCGFRILYKKDIEDLNRTMAQSSNTDIIPYEDFGVKRAKQICDDYDGARPCGDGSSDDVPHGNSDSEEYFECGEQISDQMELENGFKYSVSQ